jgi:4-amino-4-deoxychorismate lyase
MFIETFRIANKQWPDFQHHNKRLNNTRQYFWPAAISLDLADVLRHATIEIPQEGICKGRITYGLAIEKIEIEPYTPRRIETLKIIEAPSLDYRFKYQDRTDLNELFAQRGTADDVLITQQGYLTDTSYANIALWNGRRWHTPARPLLAGTARAWLLSKQILTEMPIKINDLPNYTHLRILNAMLPFDEAPALPIAAIVAD